MKSSAVAFLQQCHRRKTVNRKRTSYGWKHIAERAIGGYISNEQLIEAAIELGFTVRPVAGTSNAFINISESAARPA